jgi:hypothetical protein
MFEDFCDENIEKLANAAIRLKEITAVVHDRINAVMEQFVDKEVTEDRDQLIVEAVRRSAMAALCESEGVTKPTVTAEWIEGEEFLLAYSIQMELDGTRVGHCGRMRPIFEEE